MLLEEHKEVLRQRRMLEDLVSGKAED